MRPFEYQPLNTPFEYRPLETPETIRVVQIRFEGSVPDTSYINCNIGHITLDNQFWAALSYEWGPSADDDPQIRLNGRFCRVRRNLHDALLALRQSDLNIVVWIDALSINQSDTLERNHQVQLMGTIYRRAAAVIIWPGLTRHFDERALNTINESIHAHSTGSSVWQDAVSPAIIELCRKPYWNRVWVQQEVFLGGIILIMCPRGKWMKYQAFDHILGRTTQDDSLCGAEISSMIQESAANALVTRKRLPMGSSRLITWLRLACHRGLETSEPRDLIYAMLGISSDCQDGGIKPDYDKPLIDVYLETIYFCGLHKPGQENKQFRRTLAEKLGLSWDGDMETRIQEYREQNAAVQRED